MARPDRPETARLTAAVRLTAPVRLTAAVVGATTARLWSVPQETRLARLAKRVGAGPLVPADALPAEGRALLFRADAIVEERLAKALAGLSGVVLTVDAPGGGRHALAAAVEGAEACAAAAALLLADRLPDAPPAGLVYRTATEIAGGYDPVLRKQAAPVAARLEVADPNDLERLTFAGSYKGATDFVTKYVWPWPARHVTRWCAAAGVSPNQVTTLSLVLVLLAFAGFWQSAWAWALPAAWAMTFLDTVDGKLARVTLVSSKWGEVYDHGIDLIHPPFWWWAWHVGAAEMAAGRGGDFMALYDWALWAILAGYVIQRVYEGAFLWLFRIEGHIWRPFDFAFRTVTARRNPNLFILTVGAIFGAPDIALIVVAAWVVLSLAVHFVRFAQAAAARLGGHPVVSFLKG